MKAIIVPGVTDLNKGDQALVWESYRIIKDTNIFDEIYVLDSGDTPSERELLCSQTESSGLKLISNILRHPRRGKHIEGEFIKDSILSKAKLGINAISDFLFTKHLLSICNNLDIVRSSYGNDIADTIETFRSVTTVFVKGGGFYTCLW